MLAGSARSSKSLALAGFAVGIGSIAYFAYQKWTTGDSEAAEKEFKENWEAAKTLVERDTRKSILDKDTVEAVQELIAKSCGKEYMNLVISSRLNRRSIPQDDRLGYEAAVIQSYQDINALILKYTQKIVSQLNLDYSKFEESVEKLIEDNQYEETAATMLSILRSSLIDPSKYKHYTDEEIMEMYTFCNEEYSLYKPRLATFRGPIKAAVLEDALFTRYAIEEEQLDYLSRKRSRVSIDAARFSLEKMKQDETDYRGAGPDSILLQKLNQQPVLLANK